MKTPTFREFAARKNPAELPASRPNSGAGTEKRPCCQGRILTAREGVSRKNLEKMVKTSFVAAVLSITTPFCFVFVTRYLKGR